ncbi:hypothetical protein D9757_000831 [Collybiopsis confluens]|uniref:Uncharacterized protein n=1 Tax=Collybiopsis confluens TaxID=2823264 RepID=A0A8H5I0R3_9AGAR|nr:hypothetical protein D9757_000831 [Collybiopsis confluens]
MDRLLPVEILNDVLAIALENSSAVGSVLCVSSLFYALGGTILHRKLRFYSVSQLLRFADSVSSSSTTRLACEPQSIELDIAGGAASLGLFQALNAALITLVSDSQCKTDEEGRLLLETLRLRLNSLTLDNHQLIYTSLSKVNARSFVWTGPDPPHHFSTAIVAPAVFPLFTALASYTRLTHLHLTNIAFPDPIVTPDLSWSGIPCLPSVRVLYLGQATFLTAEHIADYLLRCIGHHHHLNPNSSSPSCSLERLHLVDVYEESIWGSRSKLPRILAAAGTKLLAQSPESESSQLDIVGILDSIAKIVSTDAKTERIMGGDRVIPERASAFSIL